MRLPPRDQLHTTEQAAEALDIKAGTIRQWKRQGRAQPAGVLRAPVPGGLQPLWLLAELEPLAETYHARKQHRAPRRKPLDV